MPKQRRAFTRVKRGVFDYRGYRLESFMLQGKERWRAWRNDDFALPAITGVFSSRGYLALKIDGLLRIPDVHPSRAYSTRYTPEQLDWIDRIGSALLRQKVIDFSTASRLRDQALAGNYKEVRLELLRAGWEE